MGIDHTCARLSWPHSAFRSTLNSSIVSYRIVSIQRAGCCQMCSLVKAFQRMLVMLNIGEKHRGWYFSMISPLWAYGCGTAGVPQHPQAVGEVGNFEAVGNFRLSVSVENFHNMYLDKTHSLLLQKCFFFRSHRHRRTIIPLSALCNPT